MSSKGKEKTDTKILAYFLAFLLIVLATILAIQKFYVPNEDFGSYSYNGFIFTNITGLWYTELQKSGTNISFRVPLHYGPKDLEDIKVENVPDFRNFTAIYITFNPLEKDLSYVALSISELSINLVQTLGITPVAACIVNETAACISRPIIDCNSGEPSIFLNQEPGAMVYMNNSCIVIQGEGKDLVRATDRLLLYWFSVMK